MPVRDVTTLPYTEFITATGNYDESRAVIDRIVLHTSVSSAQSAITHFGTQGTQVSAHYIIGLDGTIYHGLEERFTAYHSGNYEFNQRSIGVEHADDGKFNDPRPDILYSKSAQLIADICSFYSIPCDADHIFRHHDVPGASTACPDALDTNRIIREAQTLLTPVSSSTQDQKDIDSMRALRQHDALFVDSNAILLALSKRDDAISRDDTTIRNLNNLLNQKSNQNDLLSAQISTLKTQLTDMTSQKDTAYQQALKVPELQKAIDELELQKRLWAQNEQSYLTQIKQLQDKIPHRAVPLLLFTFAQGLETILNKLSNGKK